MINTEKLQVLVNQELNSSSFWMYIFVCFDMKTRKAHDIASLETLHYNLCECKKQQQMKVNILGQSGLWVLCYYNYISEPHMASSTHFWLLKSLIKHTKDSKLLWCDFANFAPKF